MAGDEPDKKEESAVEQPAASTSTAEGEDSHPKGKDGDEEDTGAQVAPIVELKEVETASGEEDEEVLFEIKAKLYRFDRDKTEWKERGVGLVKLLQHKENKKIRLLMRQNRTLKICANHIVLPGMDLQEHAGNEKSWVWAASDFADGELKDEMFTIRFGSIESAQKFRDAFYDAAEKMGELLGVSPDDEEEGADEAAEALEGLKVGGGDKAVADADEEEKPVKTAEAEEGG